MLIRPMDIRCQKQVLRCSDDGGGIAVTDNKLFKGGDERPLWLWCFVSLSPPRCEFFTSRTKTERATMREAYAIAGTLID